MRVSISQLQVVNSIFEQIVDLEDSKKDLEELAARLSEGSQDVQLVINPEPEKSGVDSETERVRAAKKQIADSFGIPPDALRHAFVDFGGGNTIMGRPYPQKLPQFIDEDIPDTLALQIIGLLIGHKKAKIKVLVDRLVEMGFTREQ